MLRRFFIKKAMYVASLTCLLPACGDSPETEVPENNELACSSNNPITSINANHGHTLVVPISDINSDTPNTYTLSSVGHTHSISLSTTDIQTLIDDGVLMKVTTTASSHSHLVTITCAG